jgi:hypothetical protein
VGQSALSSEIHPTLGAITVMGKVSEIVTELIGVTSGLVTVKSSWNASPRANWDLGPRTARESRGPNGVTGVDSGEAGPIPAALMAATLNV